MREVGGGGGAGGIGILLQVWVIFPLEESKDSGKTNTRVEEKKGKQDWEEEEEVRKEEYDEKKKKKRKKKRWNSRIWPVKSPVSLHSCPCAD